MQYKDTLMWQELNLAPQVLETLAQKNQAVLDKIAAEIAKNSPQTFIRRPAARPTTP